jgi:Endonuclease related to archaeal Holliday junction resolvase
MPWLTAVAIIALALLIAAALFIMYEIGRLVGEKTATDKFPEAKKAAVRRSRSVLGGIFAEQLAPYLPNFPFSPTEAKFIGAPIDFLVFKGMDVQHVEEVIFVEVKSGSARLNHNEHSLNAGTGLFLIYFIRKSAFVFPFASNGFIQRGAGPLPLHSSPLGPRYLAGCFPLACRVSRVPRWRDTEGSPNNSSMDTPSD